jgi:predicted  nucleic acid-binding Zn-ribbon protein
MAEPDAGYQGVLAELDAISLRFCDLLISLDVDGIQKDIDGVSKQSRDQMEMLRRLKDKIEDLNAELESKHRENEYFIDKTRLLENALNISREQVASGMDGENSMNFAIDVARNQSSALAEEVKRLESALENKSHDLDNSNNELMDAQRENVDLNTRLVRSEEEALYNKNLVEDLESRLEEATNALSAALIENAELTGELYTVRGLSIALQQSPDYLTAEDDGGVALPIPGGTPGVIPNPGVTPVAFLTMVNVIPDDDETTPVALNRKYTQRQINELLAHMGNNIYLNSDIAPKFRCEHTSNRGMVLDPKNLKKIIDIFLQKPDRTQFNAGGNFLLLLGTHDLWGPGDGDYKDKAQKYMQLLNR